MMRQVLAYGDSNTWGQVAYEERQIPKSERWTTILSRLISDVNVAPEGKCARIAGSYESDDSGLNGQDDFAKALKKYLPLDFLIIALGTNDLKARYGRSPANIADDLLWYNEKTQRVCDEMSQRSPMVIYVAPPNFSASKDYFAASDEVRLQVIDILRSKAEKVLAINDFELSEDGVHISIDDHEKLADELAKVIKEVI